MSVATGTTTAIGETPKTAPQAGARRAPGSRHDPAGHRMIAGVHAQGDTVRVVIARAEPGSSLPRVVESKALPIADAPALAALLKQHKVDNATRVVHSTSTVCRSLPVPADLAASPDRQEVAAALSLLAESELPTMLPAHRRAAGVIRPGPAGAPDAVLCVGWPARDNQITKLGIKNEQWAAELVALAAVAKALGGAGVSLYADRESGSIALIVAGKERLHEPGGGAVNGTAKSGAAGGSGGGAGGRTLARVLRGDNSSDAAWRSSIARAVAETQASIGQSTDPAVISVPLTSVALVLAGNAGSRTLPGAPSEPNWQNQFGIAYGAILCALDPDPAAASLAGLRADAVRERRSLVVAALEWCSTPRNAVLVLLVCIAFIIAWPWAVAAGRVWILSARTGGQEALKQRLSEADRRVAFYSQLKDKRWPMTKLLADIAGASPEGVTIESLSINREQGLNLRGKANNNELVDKFATNLDTSSVFSGIGRPTTENVSAGITFELKADVSSPLFTGRRAQDYGSPGKTLFDRLYGPRDKGATSAAPAGASTSPAPSSSTPAAAANDADKAASSRPRRTETERAASDAATERVRSKPATTNSLPEPLTDAAIAKMDSDTAMKEWTSRKKAAGRAELDAETKQRLLDEAEKCKARMTAARGGG